MSQEAIYSTLYATLALADSIFQIWITLTFAVLIATYVAERRFDHARYRLVSALYAFASGILFVRFASAAYQAFHYKNLLRTRGFEPCACAEYCLSHYWHRNIRLSPFRNGRHTLVCA
jgi:hypothetical protein